MAAVIKEGETKEERRARKEATRLAKAAAADAAGPSTLPAADELVREVEDASKSIKKDKKSKKSKKSDPNGGDVSRVASKDVDDEEERKRRKRENKEKKRQSEGEANAIIAIQHEEEGVALGDNSKSTEDLVEAKEQSAVVPKQSKKEKRKRDVTYQGDEAVTTTEQSKSDVGDNKSGKSKKAKKEKMLEGVPTSDEIFAVEGISDQAKKAIHYTQQYALSHAKSEEEVQWKFQKARQIWLVKHIWDGEEIPDKYVDLVVGYLKTIQGLGRAGLIDSAKKRRDAPIPSLPVTVTTETEATEQPKAAAQEEVQVVGEEKQETKADDSEEPLKGEGKVDEPVDEESIRKLEVAKYRAERLLKAMGAR